MAENAPLRIVFFLQCDIFYNLFLFETTCAISAEVVSSNLGRGQEYLIQQYVITIVSDVRQVGCVLWVLVGESVQPFNKRMNGHRSDLTKKTLSPVSQHFVSPGHSLDDFGRSKINIIDHNPS